MNKGLTPNDVRILVDTIRRVRSGRSSHVPLARNRRHPILGGSSVALSVGIVTGSAVPPGRYNASAQEFIPGYLAGADVWPLGHDTEKDPPIKFIRKQGDSGFVTLPALNYTQQTIDPFSQIGRVVTGFSSTIEDAEYFVIVTAQRGGIVHATTTAAVTSTMLTFTANQIVVDTSPQPLNASGFSTGVSSFTVQNTFKFNIAAQKLVRAEQNERGLWVCVQAEC